MKRTTFLKTTSVGLTLAACAARAEAAPTRITIYRDTGCGCCEGWSAALHSAGYNVDVRDIEREKRLSRFALSEQMASCHTGVVESYLVEGHVPLAAVAKLLREKPKTRGIALPGMPSGTPGMPGPHTALRVVFLEAPHRAFYSE